MSTYYTEDHEWITIDGDVGTVGISNYAQNALGDIVFVELPDIGASFAKGDDAAVVESVKAASDVYAPVGGEITETNGALEDAPETVNSDAGGELIRRIATGFNMNPKMVAIIWLSGAIIWASAAVLDDFNTMYFIVAAIFVIVACLYFFKKTDRNESERE